MRLAGRRRGLARGRAVNDSQAPGGPEVPARQPLTGAADPPTASGTAPASDALGGLGRPDGRDTPRRPAGRRPPRIRRAMNPRLRSVLSWAWVLVSAVVLAVLMRTFLIAAFYIPSESMEPVLEVGDRLLVSKLSYRIGDPSPGDVVVFRTPSSMQPAQTAELIKRVVAVGRQQVEAVHGQIYVDGTPADEEYLPADAYTRDFGPVLVPDGHVFVMGDNRGSSQDSRVFGAIPESDIVGRAFARFWPLNRLGGL